jgi:PRC-barrel domain
VSPQARKVRVADLVGSRIVDSDGRIIGRVVDLAVTDGPPYRLTEILSSGWEWLDRLEVLRLFRYHLRGHPTRTASRGTTSTPSTAKPSASKPRGDR